MVSRGDPMSPGDCRFREFPLEGFIPPAASFRVGVVFSDVVLRRALYSFTIISVFLRDVYPHGPFSLHRPPVSPRKAIHAVRKGERLLFFPSLTFVPPRGYLPPTDFFP